MRIGLSAGINILHSIVPDSLVFLGVFLELEVQMEHHEARQCVVDGLGASLTIDVDRDVAQLVEQVIGLEVD